MSTLDNSVTLGFESPVFNSQKNFRLMLKAMSEPGSVFSIEGINETPTSLNVASYAIALTIFDKDTKIFLDDALNNAQLIKTLRFHSSIKKTDCIEEADFVICNEAQLPNLSTLKLGSEEYPDQSCTLIIQSESFTNGQKLIAKGPGIFGSRAIQCSAISKEIMQQRNVLSAQFPKGVDLIFTHQNKLMCLPRTTSLCSENS